MTPTGARSTVKVALLTTTAMLAFAANSILCRLALGDGLIDAASFASLRLLSGAVCLLAIVAGSQRHVRLHQPRPVAVIALAAYMACFSFAYLSLSTGTGALLLFGAVQLTMLTTAVYRGEQLHIIGWAGVAIAMAGLLYLLAPGIEAPDPHYSLLMIVAGIAWGIYSLAGQAQSGADVVDPVQSTAANFVYALPLTLVVSGITIAKAHITLMGAVYGIASGALASGVGYTLWYAALRHISASTAATVQLSVPAIAALGGVLFMAENLSLRLIVATVMTLGGIAIVLSRLSRPQPDSD